MKIKCVGKSKTMLLVEIESLTKNRVGIKHKRIMTNKIGTKRMFLLELFDETSLEWLKELNEQDRLDYTKTINLSVLRDLCVVGVNNTMVIQGIEYKVDYSTYEEIMDFYENEKIGKLPPFLRKIIEMCLEDLIITNNKVKETFINQLVRATIKTFFDTTIDELEMIYQYGEEYFERYREELPTKNKKVVSG